MENKTHTFPEQRDKFINKFILIYKDVFIASYFGQLVHI